MKLYTAPIKGLFLFLVLVAFSSCASTFTSRSGRTTSFYPDQVRFDLTSSDFEYLGEMDISVQYSQYLRFFRIFEYINGNEVNHRSINSMAVYGKRSIPLSPILNRALYDVYVKYPEADFTIPSYEIAEYEKLFLGRKAKKTARIKVYKLKI